MMKQPLLSIVIPTRGDFKGYGCNQVLTLEGNLEFIIVHPPGTEKFDSSDPRVKQIISPLRSEVFQRCLGIINTTGDYVVTLDQDQAIHPQIERIVEGYFSKHPDSWVLRSISKKIFVSEAAENGIEWCEANDIFSLGVSSKEKDNYQLFREKKAMAQVPIVPLDKKRLDMRLLFLPFVERKDQNGLHTETANKKVWQGDMIRSAAREIAKSFDFVGSIKDVPFWCLDRLLGLWIQAQFFKKDIYIGHWSPTPFVVDILDDEQIRRHKRFYLAADILLIKKFPQYGYFWNLCFSQTAWIPVRAFRFFKKRLKGILQGSK